MMENLPLLNAVESRILGVLMEKEKATPEYYPMTLNGLTNGCNQKSSRNPVVNYSEEEVQVGIDGLKKYGLILTVTGGGSRVFKYKHNASIVFDLDDRQETVLCLLLLRGPLTPGEINSNSGRLHSFSSLDSIMQTLESLMNKDLPMIVQLPKRPGQKEARFAQLLNGEVNSDEVDTHPEVTKTVASKIEERVSALEIELALIKEKLGDLLK